DLANELGNEKCANIIMLGAILKETGIVEVETIKEQLEHMFSGRKAAFLPLNQKALEIYLK
ncbi:MAG: 2-oxoacid:acceptor oxidoreductase family protein, partial [Oscillospiraceae bacterium]|nr:2-oxoacid:acceptor oxidoreductase family protein [Oscillospiraceae bacterium]